MKVFKEEQRAAQTKFLVAILIAITVILLSVFFKEKDGFSFGKNISTIVIVLLVLMLFFSMKLTTRIDEKGIYFRFFPFHFKNKFYRWDEIDKAYVRKYNAIYEYGGWGVRNSFFWKKSNGKAYNVSGDVGIQLELKNGKKILVGTCLENEAKNVLKTYHNKTNKTL